MHRLALHAFESQCNPDAGNVRLITFAAACLIAACTMASRPGLSGMSFASEPLTGKMIWHDLITEDIEAARRFYGGLFRLLLGGCQGSVGVGMSVGVPVGSHGCMSVSGTRWH